MFKVFHHASFKTRRVLVAVPRGIGLIRVWNQTDMVVEVREPRLGPCISPATDSSRHAPDPNIGPPTAFGDPDPSTASPILRSRFQCPAGRGDGPDVVQKPAPADDVPDELAPCLVVLLGVGRSRRA